MLQLPRSEMERRSGFDRRFLSEQNREALKCCQLTARIINRAVRFVGIQEGCTGHAPLLLFAVDGHHLCTPWPCTPNALVERLIPASVVTPGLGLANHHLTGRNAPNVGVAPTMEKIQMRTHLTKRSFILLLCFFTLRMAVPRAVAAQITSNTATVALSMNVGESIAVSGVPVSITLTPSGTGATASGPINVNTSYNFSQVRRLWVVAYFTSATAALSNGSFNIPAAQVLGSVDGGTAVACNQTETNVNGSGATPLAQCPDITTLNPGATGTGSLPSHSLLLSLTGGPFPAGNYTGVIAIVAQSN
jgi:hypothetical protein